MSQQMSDTDKKLEIVKKHIATFNRVMLALSGGVDSSLLLKLCTDILGREHVIAVTVVSEFTMAEECERACDITSTLGIEHITTRLHLLQYADIAANLSERCYLCKYQMFSEISKLARERGINHIIEGSNADDLNEFRPGLKALDDLSIESPLLEAGITKKEVRFLSGTYGLSDPERPSQSCLATRIPLGEPITKNYLEMIEKAENILRTVGFDYIRVRHQGSYAIIEVKYNQIAKLTEESIRDEIVYQLKSIGYKRVCLDLEGYRKGSMNEMMK